MQGGSTETCYVCDRAATTREHAPPKCFFPEQKDVGRDLRKNLISVPSCRDHNTARSNDDQYVMAIVVMHFMTTGVARSQFATKIIRTLKRSTPLVKSLFRQPKNVTVDGERTVAVGIDRVRFNRVMECTCRALVFHHSGERIQDEVTIFSTGIFHPHRLERDSDESSLELAVRRILEGQPRLGENPEVFWYQFVHIPTQLTAVRLEFYGGFTVYGASDTRLKASAANSPPNAAKTP